MEQNTHIDFTRTLAANPMPVLKSLFEKKKEKTKLKPDGGR